MGGSVVRRVVLFGVVVAVAAGAVWAGQGVEIDNRWVVLIGLGGVAVGVGVGGWVRRRRLGRAAGVFEGTGLKRVAIVRDDAVAFCEAFELRAHAATPEIAGGGVVGGRNVRVVVGSAVLRGDEAGGVKTSVAVTAVDADLGLPTLDLTPHDPPELANTAACVSIDDGPFDEVWRVQCDDPEAAKRILVPAIRRWLVPVRQGESWRIGSGRLVCVGVGAVDLGDLTQRAVQLARMLEAQSADEVSDRSAS